MKMIIAKIDGDGNVYTKEENQYIGVVTPEQVKDLKEYTEGSTNSLKELVAAGLTADDLIKLKHGGVL